MVVWLYTLLTTPASDTVISDVIMGAMVSQITSLTTVYSTVYSGAENIKAPRHWPLCGPWIHRGPVNAPYKWPVTRKMFPLDDVIMTTQILSSCLYVELQQLIQNICNAERNIQGTLTWVFRLLLKFQWHSIQRLWYVNTDSNYDLLVAIRKNTF